MTFIKKGGQERNVIWCVFPVRIYPYLSSKKNARSVLDLLGKKNLEKSNPCVKARLKNCYRTLQVKFMSKILTFLASQMKLLSIFRGFKRFDK